MAVEILPVPANVRNDLTGQTFGNLRVIGYSHGGWCCLCVCGEKHCVRTYGLKRARKKRQNISCGCKAKYFTGAVFNRLVLVARADDIHVGSQGRQVTAWNCKCRCGTECVVPTSHLNGGQLSCGCEGSMHKVKAGDYSRTHGKSQTGAYRSYQRAKRRCTDPNNNEYARYSANGIKFLFESFEQFYAELGDRPEGHSVERIDNAKSYAPGNVKWATPREQANNTSKNIRIKYHGETKTLAQWCRTLNLPYAGIRNRIRTHGWTAKRAFETPFPTTHSQ